MNDRPNRDNTSRDYIDRVLFAATFADEKSGIPEMCDLIRALRKEADVAPIAATMLFRSIAGAAMRKGAATARANAPPDRIAQVDALAKAVETCAEVLEALDLPHENVVASLLVEAGLRVRDAAAATCEKWRAFAAQGGPYDCSTINGSLWFGRAQYAEECRREIAALDIAPILARKGPTS